MPQDRQIYLDKIAKAQQGQDPAAVEATFADALRHVPDDPVLLAKWAEYQFEQGDRDRARETLRKAYSLSGANQHHLKMAMCDMMYRMGMQETAGQALPEIIAAEPARETFVRIKILQSCGDEIGVRKACDHLIATADLPVERWRQVSDVARASGYPGAAIQAFLKMLGKVAATPADMAQLVNMYLENDDLDRAWAVVEAMSEAVLQHPEFLAARANCLRKRGREAEAAELYMLLRKADPGHGRAWDGLAVLAANDQLPELIEEGQGLLKGGTLSAAGEMQLGYAVASMQDRLKRTKDAFGNFQRANDRLAALFAAQGRAYDPKRAEQRRAQLTGLFPPGMFEPRAQVSQDDQPIFIVGLPRSGTSLLERILASMATVVAGGESKALARVATEHQRRMQRRTQRSPQDLDAAAWQAFADDYWAITRVRGRFVTDKLPQNYRNLGWGMKMFPAAPIIYLKRDPRDIGWSLYKQVFHSTFAYTVDQQHIAHAIRQCEEFMDHWRKVAPDRILTVQYEVLVQNPEPMTRQIADFCGLEWTEACLSPEKLDIPTFTISEQQVRQPINAKGIGRWREYEEFLQPMITALEGFDLLP